MGCAHSAAAVENEDVLWRCKERRRLMRQLVARRPELAAAHVDYLRCLRDTGAALRQFVEAEIPLPASSPLGHSLPLPPSPPPPPPHLPSSLPSSMPTSPRPPPPPPFSPLYNLGKEGDDLSGDDSDSCLTFSPRPPPPPGWYWDSFSHPSASNPLSPVAIQKGREAAVENNNWGEINTDLVNDDDEMVAGNAGPAIDNSSMVSWLTKESEIMMMSAWQSKKTLVGMVKEIDDCFLKAAAGGKDVVVLLDSTGGRQELEEQKGRTAKSAKAFSTLSWGRSFRSQHTNRGASLLNFGDECQYDYHGRTLEKLSQKEQELYKGVKEESALAMQYRKNSVLLQKLETGNQDMLHREKVREHVEELQARFISLQESMNSTCVDISTLRDEELYPQLIELAAGLVHMWRSMQECHQMQSHIAQQLDLLENRVRNEPTTDAHRHAAAQLANEVSLWHGSFCNLIKLQREYVSVLNQWIGLTDCLPDSDGLVSSSFGIRRLGVELDLVLNKLPEKAVAEAIKSFLSAIQSVMAKQDEEQQLKSNADRLDGRIKKQLTDLHIDYSIQSPSTGVHKLSRKDTKRDVLKSRAEEERSKHLQAVHTSRALAVRKLQTSLPDLFQALTGFTGACVQAFEGISRCGEAVDGQSGRMLSMRN